MKTFRRTSRASAGAAAALLVGALFAAGALAVTSPDQTRESYVAQVEPICKKSTTKSESQLKGVKKLVQEGKLKVAGGRVGQAAATSAKSVTQIKAVPQPPADAAKLGKWIGFLEKEKKLTSDLSKALNAGNKTRSQRLIVELTHNGNQANNSVLSFEFKYCLVPVDQFS